MRQAFALLGVMTLIVSIGAFVAFSKKAEAPIPNNSVISTTSMSLSLTSPAFTDGGVIPLQYSCEGENKSPEIQIGNVPEGTQSLVLVMDDPDIPDSVKQARGVEKIDHWALYNIPPTTTIIPPGMAVGIAGVNSRGSEGYVGPCPPDKEHRYFFRLYALNGTLNFIKAPTLDEVEQAVQSMVIEKATLMGRYNKSTNVVPN